MNNNRVKIFVEISLDEFSTKLKISLRFQYTRNMLTNPTIYRLIH